VLALINLNSASLKSEYLDRSVSYGTLLSLKRGINESKVKGLGAQGRRRRGAAAAAPYAALQPQPVQAQAYPLPVRVTRPKRTIVHGPRLWRRRRRLVRRANGQVEVDHAAEVPRRWRKQRSAVVGVAAMAAGDRRAAGAARELLVAGAARRGGGRRRVLHPLRGGGGGIEQRAVRVRVDAAGEELALDVRVPVVLDLVVRPPRQPPGDQRPPAERAKNRS
jgi:hypothetical protein